MKFRVSSNRRDLIVEADSQEDAAEQAIVQLQPGEKIAKIQNLKSSRPTGSNKVNPGGSWWEVWLD